MKKEVFLKDMMGKTITQLYVQKGSNYFELDKLSKGMYILQTSDGGQLKIIKK